VPPWWSAGKSAAISAASARSGVSSGNGLSTSKKIVVFAAATFEQRRIS
jgi:hypothetical protein